MCVLPSVAGATASVLEILLHLHCAQGTMKYPPPPAGEDEEEKPGDVFEGNFIHGKRNGQVRGTPHHVTCDM
jgi:hypothetical protein